MADYRKRPPYEGEPPRTTIRSALAAFSLLEKVAFSAAAVTAGYAAYVLAAIWLPA